MNEPLMLGLTIGLITAIFFSAFMWFQSRNYKWHLVSGIACISFGIILGLDGPSFSQIVYYIFGVWDIYLWWKNDDDFRNKRKKWISRAKNKLRTLKPVFQPPILAGQ